MKLFGKKEKKSEPIELGVSYFVKGEDVLFDLNGLDFTFGKFYAVVRERSLRILVEEEAPMNLIHLLGAVEDDVEVERKDVLDADTVKLELKLKSKIFNAMKQRILTSTDILDLFQLEDRGNHPLLDLSNYRLEKYGTTKELEA
jgi:hypothetical protein